MIHGIFHWRVGACRLLEVVYSALLFALRWLAGALCCGVTSESVCMLREMVVEEVGHFLAVISWRTSCRG
jgi:hypothetical protein